MVFKGRLSKEQVCIIIAVLLVAVILSCGFANAGKIFSAGKSRAEETGKSLSLTTKQSSEVSEGYRVVCYDGSSFVAAGTNGRIDRIKPDKTVTSLAAVTNVCLNGLVSMNGTDVAVGEGGVILIANDGGAFRQIKSGTAKSLYSVTSFKGTFWAAGADGILLCSLDGEHWKTMKSGVKNKILSISANEKMCMAVTKEGQILMSNDGKLWDVMDYNTFYKGCSEPCRFRSVRACGDTFFITGEYQNIPDSPAILSSETGEIWREHVLNKINDKLPEEFYPLIVNAVAVDWDQLVAACNGGKLLTVTECIVCNKLDVICGQNINDLVSADGFLALVGDSFWFDIRKSDTFRQYEISAEQALMDYNNGACIVDVRTDDEYAQQHIEGCIHIPLDELEVNLENEITDKGREIIFYCQKGVRAQKALESALVLGYKNVYNLGGIGEWLFDTESGGISDGK